MGTAISIINKVPLDSSSKSSHIYIQDFLLLTLFSLYLCTTLPTLGYHDMSMLL